MKQCALNLPRINLTELISFVNLRMSLYNTNNYCVLIKTGSNSSNIP